MSHSPDPQQAAGARARPAVARHDTQAILSYYHSPEAGRTSSQEGFSLQPQCDDSAGTQEENPSISSPPHLHLRSYSNTTDSSNYSLLSQEDLDHDVPSTARPLNRDHSTPSNDTSTSPIQDEQHHSPVHRRPSAPSLGSIDRRRLHVVQIGSPDPEQVQSSNSEHPENSQSGAVSNSPSNTILSRRGLENRLGGLALVAPPDASPKTYTNLTPPLTAPVEPVQQANSKHTANSHYRSASEAVSLGKEKGHHVRRKSSREVAIVGTESSSKFRPPRDDHDMEKRISSTAGGLRPPVFQMPQSRSPSPGASGDDSEPGQSSYAGRSKTDARQSQVSPIRELPEVSSPVRTPGIGESKNIADRVSGPVIVDLAAQSQSPASSSGKSAFPGLLSPHSQSTSPPSSHTSTSPTTSSPYLYYQPGIHATAGPLPPPPMAILSLGPKSPPPPRPPRLNSPFRRKGDADAPKQTPQAPSSSPPSGVDAPSSGPKSPLSPLAQQSPPFHVDEAAKDSSTGAKKTEEETDQNTTTHVREGAFPPSRITETSPPTPPKEAMKSPTRIGSFPELAILVGDAIDDVGIVKASDTPPPSVVEPPRMHERSRKDSGLDIRHRSRGSDESQTTSGSSEPSPHTVDSATHISFAPSVPSKGVDYSEFGVELSGKGRMSNSQWHRKQNSTLPRTPSFLSMKRLSVGTKRSSRTPSPNSFWEITPRRVPPSRKDLCAWPAAMQFADVLDRPSALGRSIGYAEKINELYHYDCGLGDWIVDTKARAANPQSYKRSTLRDSGPRLPSEFAADHQPRKVSQGSMESEMTFPRRPDAYLATDLRSGPSLEDTPAPPPALPYPGLAALPARPGPSRASTLLIPPSSLNKTPGGFFSSLGRKTSVRKDRPVNSPSFPSHKVLSKQPPRLPPRSVNIVSPPPLPGGPRAPPNRVQRAQTLITNIAYAERTSRPPRRPSLFTANGSGSSDNTRPDSSTSFSSQVDRLSTLLPHADRSILSGYLKRAGQDVLAIGQYLEDEKNGTLRRD